MPGNLQIENYCFWPPSMVVLLTTTPTLSLSLSPHAASKNWGNSLKDADEV
jgi:hypothetical protein